MPVPKYGVPIWMRMKGFVIVEADNVKDAKALVRAGGGSVVAEESNSHFTVKEYFDGFRKDYENVHWFAGMKGIRRLTNDQLEFLLHEWDNDHGVPW